ncbi:HAD family hydrolase [Natronorubrum bangense]|uniref:Haloacid dehalogenase-like hydrolase n=2 Tax=Natronorubrum bangense TaxID=61858 RepID=L9W9S3_9EURY|nr:HAD-IA family hydrolase [Natronorubrum bangense]ELY46245.1 haloacid dehalogenase-like hydrolase [Natronorubrum bangense JCM 10635]QCC56598.1 HAD family hydrolase [Natronorubrum bangense]
MTSQQYDGLLLDHDGVIVTLCSQHVLRDAALGAFADAGVSDPNPDDVDTITIRVSEDELCAVAKRYDVTPDRLWQCREDRIETTLRTETIAGRKAPYDDVACLERVEVPRGIVSNNQTRIVDFVLREYGLRGQFGTIRAREPTRASLREKKPNPTYLEAAATDIGSSNPLYVGDSESDVVAGQRAGFDTVFLRREHNATSHLETEPMADLESLEAVLELLNDS